MTLLKTINFCLAAALFAIAPFPARAAEWKMSNDKGLLVYNIKGVSGAEATIVCDPEELWSPPIFHIVIKENGSEISGTAATMSKADKSITATMTDGIILSIDTGEWNDIISMLSFPGTVAISSGKASLSFTVDKAVKTQCTR